LTSSLLRHVAKTGDIKEFAITEESGIAKGIRRIIAVTGKQAREAHLRCHEMEERLKELRRLPDPKAKEYSYKFFNQASCPCLQYEALIDESY